MMKLNDVPWDKIWLYFWNIRRSFFKVEVPEGYTKLIIEEENLEKLRREFRKEHFVVAWPFSYHYEGEVMNVVRPEYEEDEYKFYQLHVRAFPHERGHVLMAHYELDPTDHPKEHIDEVNLDEPRGIGMLKKILEDRNIKYEEKRPDK